ncbi:MAG: twin-arginine translocation signal domain-containing protein, partial [Gammaproteobacteria bacterium]
MQACSRRGFLRSVGLSGAGLVFSRQAWALAKLQPIHDPLQHYPYRQWEDLYRSEWTWDSIGYAAH